MRAREIVRPYPVVQTTDPALTAARLLAQEDVDVLLVEDPGHSIVGALPDIAMLRFLVPDYAVEDRALARVLGAGDLSQLLARLDGRTVQDLVSREGDALPTVSADAHLVEVAAAMIEKGAPLVAVVDGTAILGGITSSALLTCLLGDR